MTRAGLVAIVLVVLLAVGLLVWEIWPPGLSAAGACRVALARTAGYGPWRMQAAGGPGAPGASAAVISFFDGYNTASCSAQRYGPLWLVTSLGQTMVGCSRGLSADGAAECPRGLYGVEQ